MNRAPFHPWLLPEAVEDWLPPEAAKAEALRRQLLDTFARAGYHMVMPPLFEYLESLHCGPHDDLDLLTFKLVDQLSGRTLGLRPDITPQVARIDAHLLNRTGVARLCYCGHVLHALPAQLDASRQPLQVGAEIYGHAGIEADIEAVTLLAEALTAVAVPSVRIDLGHVAVFRALCDAARLTPETAQQVFAALQSKDAASLEETLVHLDAAQRAPFLALPTCYGTAEKLAVVAEQLPDLPQLRHAIAELQKMLDALAAANITAGFDLADLRGYHYHNGLVFAAYAVGSASAIALGGRYDMAGRRFGQERPATGFSLNLNMLLRLLPDVPTEDSILAPADDAPGLRAAIADLRQQGQTVVRELPGHTLASWQEIGCSKRLIWQDGAWQIIALT